MERSHPQSATFKLTCLLSVILRAMTRKNLWFSFSLNQFSYLRNRLKQSSRWYLHQTKNIKTKTISTSLSSQNRWLRVKVVRTSSLRSNSSIEIQEIWNLQLQPESPQNPPSSKMMTISQCLKTLTIWVHTRHKMTKWIRPGQGNNNRTCSWNRRDTEGESSVVYIQSRHSRMNIWKRKMSHCSYSRGLLLGFYKKRIGCSSILKIRVAVSPGKGVLTDLSRGLSEILRILIKWMKGIWSSEG